MIWWLTNVGGEDGLVFSSSLLSSFFSSESFVVVVVVMGKDEHKTCS